MATTGSFSAYAAHIGKSPAYVNKLMKAGRLVMVKDAGGGKDLVSFELSDRLVMNTTDLGRANNGANSLPAKTTEAAAAAPPPMAPPIDAGRGKVDALFRQAKAQEAAFSAKTAELNYQRATGQVIQTAQAERGIFDAFRAMRDEAFAGCQRAAPKCLGLGDARAIERVMSDELRQAFERAERRLTAMLPKKDAG